MQCCYTPLIAGGDNEEQETGYTFQFDASFSNGLQFEPDKNDSKYSVVVSVQHASQAFNAGVEVGMRLSKVSGKRCTSDKDEVYKKELQKPRGYYTLTLLPVENEFYECLVDRDGLPLPIDKRQGVTFRFCAWLFSLGLVLIIIWWVKKVWFINLFIPLSENVMGSMSLHNCDVVFRPYSDLNWWRWDYLQHIHHMWKPEDEVKSMLHIRYPKLWNTANLSWDSNGCNPDDSSTGCVDFSLDMGVFHRRSFLACRATFYLIKDPGYDKVAQIQNRHFGELRISMVSSSTNVLDASFTTNVSTEFFYLDAYQAQVRVHSGLIAQYAQFNVTDGVVEIRANTSTFPDELYVETRKAPIAIVTQDVDQHVDLSKGAANMSLVWASGSIKGYDHLHPDKCHKTKLLTGSKSNSMITTIKTPELFGPGVYLLANASDRSAECKTGNMSLCMGKAPEWGLGQHKVIMNPAGLLRLEKIRDWVAEDTKAPYIIYIHIVNPNLPHGTWRFMSSQVYLAFSTEMFVMFSAGMLRPRQQKITLHIDGLWSWPPGYPKVWDDKLMREHCFKILYDYFDHTSTSALVFSPSNTSEPALIYEMGNNNRVLARPIQLDDNFLFVFASLLNLICGLIVSAVIVSMAYSYGLPVLFRKISEAQCSLVSSHRLQNQVGQATSNWRVLCWVSNCDLAGNPSHGIQFRWKVRERAKHFTRYSLRAKGKKYFFEPRLGQWKPDLTSFEARLSKAQVKTVKGNPGQVEFFMSTRHPNTKEALEIEPFHDPLEYGRRYRFIFRGIDKMGNVLETSQETNVLEMHAPTPLTELPFMLCQFFFPAPIDTLKEFVHEHTRPALESTMIFVIRDMLVRYVGSDRDPALENDWRVFFYFGDNADVAKEATKNGGALSYACSDNQARVAANEVSEDGYDGIPLYTSVVCDDGRNEYRLARPTVLTSALQLKSLNIGVCLGSDETVGTVALPVRSLLQCWDMDKLPAAVRTPSKKAALTDEKALARDITYKVRLAETEGFSAEACAQIKFNVGFRYYDGSTAAENQKLDMRGLGLGSFFDLDIMNSTYFSGFNRLLTWNVKRIDLKNVKDLTFHLVFVAIDYEIPSTDWLREKCGKHPHPRKALRDERNVWFPSKTEQAKGQKPKLATYITRWETDGVGKGQIPPSKGIPATTCAFSWTVFLDVEIFDYLNSDSVRCRIDVLDGSGPIENQKSLKLQPPRNSPETTRDAACPEFFIQRCLLLGDFEIAYAAYCRFNKVPMQQVDPSKLDEMGIRILKPQLAIVKGVREFFPFEEEDRDQYDYALMSEGAVVYGEDLPYKLEPHDPEDGERDSQYRSKKPTEVVRVPVIDNFALKPTRRWKQRYLLSRGCDYTPFAVTSILQPIYDLLPDKAPWASYFLGFVYFLLVRIGWFTNMLGIFILQTLLFQFSTLFIVFCLILFCWAQVLCHPEYWVHDVFSENQISDMAFSQSAFFVGDLPDQVVNILWLVLVESLVFHFLVFWGNFGAQFADVNMVLFVEKFAKFWWAKSLFLSIGMIVVVTLWFILGALIDPEAMMPVAVATLSLLGTAKSLYAEFTGLQERVLDVVNDQVDMILGVVLDVFFEVTGITDADIQEFTTEETNNANKIKAAIEARFATVGASGDKYEFDQDKATKKKSRAAAQQDSFTGSLANLARLRRAHRYFMNLVDVEDCVKLMGNMDLLACVKKGGADEIQKIFNLTWASTMVPYFGDSAKNFADPTVIQDLGGALLPNKNIQVTLWQWSQSAKESIAGLYCDMMEDLYDRDDITEKIAAFFDTELALMLQNEINLMLSASSATSLVQRMSRDMLESTEAIVLQAATQGVRYAIVRDKSQDSTCQSFLDLLVEIGVVPEIVEDKDNLCRNIYTTEKLVAEVLTHRDQICSTSNVNAVQSLDIVKRLLRGKITWAQFNFILVVLGINDVEESMDDQIKNTIFCQGPSTASYSGIYQRDPKRREKKLQTKGLSSEMYEPAVFRWSSATFDEQASPEDPENTYLQRLQEVVRGKKVMYWEHWVDGVLQFRSGMVKSPNVPYGSSGTEGWTSAIKKSTYPAGMVYYNYFDEEACAQECKKTTLYKRDVRDGLSVRARKLFLECSGRTGLMDVHTAADTILMLTKKKIWKTAGCALLKKLAIGGQYGNENYHDRDRGFENLNMMKGDDGMWLSPVDHVVGDKDARNPLRRARAGWYPAEWWCTKHPVFDWQYKESSRELSLKECWDMLCKKEDRLGIQEGEQPAMTGAGVSVQKWMSRGSFFNFLDCVRFFPTTDAELVKKGGIELNHSNPYMYDQLSYDGPDASEEIKLDDGTGRVLRIFGGRPRWREEVVPEWYPGQKFAPHEQTPKKGEMPYARIARCGVRKIYHKPEGENVWYRIKGITLEQCEDLLVKVGYNVQARALRNQWKRFISLPYCPFNVLYSGVLQPKDGDDLYDENGNYKYDNHKQEYRFTIPDDEEPGMEMSLFQFCGTRMMTIEKFRYLLRQLNFSLPPDIELMIFNKCDNPPHSTPYGTLKNLYNNGMMSVKMLGSQFKAIVENTKKEAAFAIVWEQVKKWLDTIDTNLKQQNYAALNANYPKEIDADKRWKKLKERLVEIQRDINAQASRQKDKKYDATRAAMEFAFHELRALRPRYIVRDGSDEYSSDAFVEQAVQLVLDEPKIMNLNINDKEEKITLPGPRDIRLYLVDSISFQEAQKEVTANTYKTIKDFPADQFSFPPPSKDSPEDTPLQSLEKLFKKVSAAVTEPNDCIVTLSVRCIEGYIGDWRGAVVSINDLKDALCEYVKRGLVFEACQDICKDRLGLTHSTETLRKAFEAVDIDKNGYLEPNEFYLMLLKLFKMGMTFEQLYSLMTRLGLKIQREALLRTFQQMDIDQDGSLGTAEFITGIETLLCTVIPTTVLERTGLTPPKIILTVSVALSVLLLVFVFIFLSMSAFTGPAATSAGIQSVLMAGSAFIVRSENGAPDIEKLKTRIKDFINEVMGIDKKQASQAAKSQRRESNDGK